MKNIFSSILTISLLVLSAVSCKTTSELNISESLIAKTIEAHGGKKYDTAHYQFDFRDKTYIFKNGDGMYHYTRTHTDGDLITKDILDNKGIHRYINNKEVELTDRDKDRYSESVNSVIYFATLPHKLQDPAVQKKHLGSTVIKGKEYDIMEIYFNKENGGKDHDDVFHYWIDKKDHAIGYLAYKYSTNKGGVRFRSAYNRRIVGGIIFQDYINYKAEVGTPLIDLPALYEQDKLKKLSVIATENVVEHK